MKPSSETPPSPQHDLTPSLSLHRPHQRIQLRKAYWDISIDQVLYDDPIALNLLYIEAIADIKNEFITVPDEVQDELTSHRAAKARKQFLGVVRTLPGYGFVSFPDSTCSYPERSTGAVVRMGHTMLDLTLEDGTNHKFAVQRMRCWRTYTVDDGIEMEFEYFFDTEDGEGKMKWVKVMSSQTIHMAMCLQLLVEEMIRIKDGKPLRKPSDREGKVKPRRQTDQVADLTFLTSAPGDADGGAGKAAKCVLGTRDEGLHAVAHASVACMVALILAAGSFPLSRQPLRAFCLPRSTCRAYLAG